MARVTVCRFIKEPPGPIEVEVTEPMLWRGRFTSTDGETWWSPVLERNLGLYLENPGERSILEALRTMARGHLVNRLQAVAEAARHLLATASGSGYLDELTAARERLEAALAAVASPVNRFPARYEPEPNEPEPELP